MCAFPTAWTWAPLAWLTATALWSAGSPTQWGRRAQGRSDGRGDCQAPSPPCAARESRQRIERQKDFRVRVGDLQQ